MGLKNCVVSRRGQQSPPSAGNVPLERCVKGRECWLTTHRPTRWRCNPSCMCGSTMTTTTKAQQSKAPTKTSETIHTNKKHPFLTVEKGFVTVGQLRVGMHVV